MNNLLLTILNKVNMVKWKKSLDMFEFFIIHVIQQMTCYLIPKYKGLNDMHGISPK